MEYTLMDLHRMNGPGSISLTADVPSNFQSSLSFTEAENSQPHLYELLRSFKGKQEFLLRIQFLQKFHQSLKEFVDSSSNISKMNQLLPSLFSQIENETNILRKRLEVLIEFYRFISTTTATLTSSPFDNGYFSILPSELKMHILSFLDIQCVARMAQLNKEWYSLCSDEELWQNRCSNVYPNLKKPVSRSWKWLFQSNYHTFVQKMKNGVGSFLYQPEGHRYFGDWKNDQRDGYGVYLWNDKRKYSGEWRNDKRNHYGRYTYPDGTSYEGAWKDDKRCGIGTYSWPDGRHYTGQWMNHRKNGRGVHVWADGSRYIGQWFEGSRNGQGDFFWADGRKYSGEWMNGKMNGIGKFTWPNGDMYFGEWRQGCRWGKGTFVAKDGSIWDQEWEEMKFDKNCKGIEHDETSLMSVLSRSKKRKAEDISSKESYPICTAKQHRSNIKKSNHGNNNNNY